MTEPEIRLTGSLELVRRRAGRARRASRACRRASSVAASSSAGPKAGTSGASAYAIPAGVELITGFDKSMPADETILATLDQAGRAALPALLTKITADLAQPTRSPE